MVKPKGARSGDPGPQGEAAGPDPVGAYLREIASRALLSAAEECELGQQMADGRAALRAALNRIPLTASHVIELGRRLRADGARLADIVRLVGDETEEHLVKIRRCFLASVDELDCLLAERRTTRDVDRERIAEVLDAMQLADPVHDDALHALEELQAGLNGRPTAARELAELAGLPATDLAERMREIRRIVHRIEAAAERFVESNLRLVVTIAKGYTNRGLALLDLIQEGNLGLMRAVRRFDHRLGFRFATYGSYWIKQSMNRAVVRDGPVYVPWQAGEDVRRIRAATRAAASEQEREPSLDELSQLTGIDAARIGELLAVMRQPVVLDASVNTDGTATHGDLLIDWRMEGAGDVAEGGDMDDKTERVLATLPPREQVLLRLRFGMGDDRDHCLAEIGERFGVSRERVRQLEAKALAMLRMLRRS